MGEPNFVRLLPAALLAGFAGTAVMTLGQKVEQKLTHRENSRTPAQGVERATGLEPHTDEGEERLSNFTHWTYGTSLGLGLLALRRVDEPTRAALFFGGVWALALGLESFANPDEPVTRWGAKAFATDVGHHIVYAAATATAFALAERALTRDD